MVSNLLTDYSLIIIGSIVTIVATGIKTGFISFLSDKAKRFFEKILHEPFDGKKISMEVDFVYSRLYEIKALSNGDRISVNRFHNGTTFLPSEPAWKITRVYEICSNGISYEASKFQNIMVMLVWDSVNAIFDTKLPKYVEKKHITCSSHSGYFYDIYEMPDTYSKVTLISHGIEYLLQFPLVSKDKIIGYLQIDYLSEKDFNLDIDQIYQNVCEIGCFLGRK